MKNTIKKVISVLLVVMIIFSTVPTSELLTEFSNLFFTKAEATDGNYGKVLATGNHGTNVTYVYYEDGTLVVSGTGSMRNDIISTAGQYNTNRRRWSGYEHQIKRAIINEGVTSIGDFAFYYCENLESVSMPSTITYIGIDAFHFCSKIKNIVIPSSVNTIRRYAFSGTNISSIIIPASVNTLESRTFHYNKSLNTVIFEKGSQLKSIGYYCFGDTSLSRIMLPSTLTSIDDYAFYNCKNLSGIYYQGSQEQWKSISKGGSNDGLYNSKIYYHCSFYGEEFDAISNTQEQTEITINVKAVDEKSGQLVPVDGATVEIKLDGKTLTSKKSVNGVATFTRNEISKTGHDISNVIKSASVVASKSIGNEMYITNFEDCLSGKLNFDVSLDKLQFRPNVSVAYNKDVVSYDKVKSTLDAFVKGFYYLTRGSILVSYSNPVAYSSDPKVSKSECDIQIGNKYKNHAITNGYKRNGYIRIGVSTEDSNAGFDFTQLCHEAMHFFVNAYDEYGCASVYGEDSYAIDINCNNRIENYKYVIYWAASVDYIIPGSSALLSNRHLSLIWEQYRDKTYKDTGGKVDIGDISNPNGIICWVEEIKYIDIVYSDENDELVYGTKALHFIFEPKGTYWNEGVPYFHGVYPRGNKRFGIMDGAKYISLHLSDESDYLYLNEADKNNVHSYTPQWYYNNNRTVEQELERFIQSKATANNYEASVLLKSMELSNSQPQLNNDYVYEEYEENITVDDNSALLESAVLNTSPLCFTFFDKSATGTTINLSSANLSNAILLVKYTDNPTYERIEAVFENGVASTEIPDSNGTIEYVYVLSENEDGTYTYNQFIYESFGEAASDGSYNSTVMTVSTANDNSASLAIYSDESSYSNGEFFSVADSFYAVELTDAEIEDTFTQTVSYNAEIDFTSVTAFMFDGEVYTPLETYVGGGENNCAYVSFPYSGEGKYVLMAKAPAETVYEAPTNLLVDDINSTHEKEIHVSFEDTNDIYDVATYNIYYSKSVITDTNTEGVTCVSVKPGNDSYTLYLTDEYDDYYFYVEVIGKDGGKSLLSEPDYFSLAPYDDDADGIPDYWLNWYPALEELEDIPGTDSDEDGLTNLQEYQNGTNPLTPDTDGDNVYDSVELWNNLNPLESMTDGVTDDYVVVYGAPDIIIEDSSFAIGDTQVTCTIKNNTNGKAMRSLIYLYIGDELVEASTVNLDANSSVDYVFSREYFVDGMRIVIDEGQITRDIDYSNNEFVYIPATGITASVSDLTVVKNTETQLEYTLVPENASKFVFWTSEDENIAAVSRENLMTSGRIGTTTVTVTTLSGYSYTYNILVEAFPGAGETVFDCQLINDDTKLEIVGYYGEETDVVIPDSIAGYPVTSIGYDAFYGCTFETIKINAGISNISEYAFYGAPNLKSIEVSEDNSFYSSENGVLFNKDKTTLICCPVSNENTSFSIPDTVTVIGFGSFYGVKNLVSVDAPESVMEVRSYAFVNSSVTVINYAGSAMSGGKMNIAIDSGIWERNITYGKFTATFVCDGEIVSQVDYKPGETIEIPDAPEKKYFIFDGWSPAVPETMPEYDINFIGTYVLSEETRVVEYYSERNLYWFDYRYEGETINQPLDLPYKNGYCFSGWFPTVPETMPGENLRFDAIYINYWLDVVPESRAYDITLDRELYISGWVYNDFGEDVDAYYWIDRGEEFVLFDKFERTDVGQVFPDCVRADCGFKSNIPIHHLSEGPHTIDIVFVTCGAGVCVDSFCIDVVRPVFNYKSDAFVSEEKYDISITKEIFLRGWAYSLDNEYVTYYYTIDDGEPIPLSNTDRSDVAAAWGCEQTDCGYSEYISIDGLSEGQHKISVYAKTETQSQLIDEAVFEVYRSYPMLFDNNNGNDIYSQNYIYGEPYGTLPQPERKHYTFLGWYADKEYATEIIVSDIFNEDSPETLYAKWEPNVYTAKFVIDGDVVDTQTFTVETEKLNEPPIPPKEGYIALWSAYSLKEGDITIVAKYHSPDVIVTSKRTLDVGESFVLMPMCNFDATQKTWYSSDTSVAKVNSNGKVTAVGEGKCKITVTYYGKDSLGNDIQAKGTTKIIVNDKPEAEGDMQSFRDAFDYFFKVKLHEILYNFKELIRSLLPYIA